MKVSFIKADITTLEVDIIVSSADKQFQIDGGVAESIHNVAGPELMAECRQVLADKFKSEIPKGSAILTNGYKLPAKHVIHTVGPQYGLDDIRSLAKCYVNSLALAEKMGAKSISFPAISTGHHGVPISLSAETVKKVLAEFTPGSLERINLVLFNDKDLSVYYDVFDMTQF